MEQTVQDAVLQSTSQLADLLKMSSLNRNDRSNVKTPKATNIKGLRTNSTIHQRGESVAADTGKRKEQGRKSLLRNAGQTTQGMLIEKLDDYE